MKLSAIICLLASILTSPVFACQGANCASFGSYTPAQKYTPPPSSTSLVGSNSDFSTAPGANGATSPKNTPKVLYPWKNSNSQDTKAFGAPRTTKEGEITSKSGFDHNGHFQIQSCTQVGNKEYIHVCK